MMRSFAAVALSMVSAVSFATATLDPDTNILTFNVESGEETYSEVLGSSIAGIVKTGAGTIILGTASTSFTSGKPVTVSGGILKITHKDALGSGNTVTVGGSATFSMYYAAASSTDGQNNDIVLEQNATLQVGGAEISDYFLGNVTLTGDATINVLTRRGFGRTLDLGGHTLTRTGNNVEFVLAGNGTAGTTAIVKGPGTILNATAGIITLMGAPSFQGDGVIESAHGSTKINLWNLSVPMPWKFKATENATFSLGRGYVGGQSANPAANIWAGDVEIAAGKTLSLTRGSYPNDYLTIAGDISGEGGISVNAVAEYRLSGTNNTYSGGTTIGGFTFKVFADGNVSTNGPVKLNGGVLEMHLENAKITSEYVSGLAAAMAQSQYSSGNGTLRFITGGAQDVTLASDLSVMHQSIGIAHAGDGSLTLTGNVHDDAMIVTRGGHLTVDGDWSRRLWAFGCYCGTMDLAGGSLWREYNGSGSNNRLTFKVGNSNDVTSARMRILDGGTLHFPALSSDGASEAVKVEDLGTKPSVLEIHSGAVVTGKVQVALDERTRGAVYQYGGDVFHMTRSGNDGAIGGFGQAYWWMEGGTFKAEHANPYLGLASRTGGESQFEVHGGTVSINGGNSLLICRGGASNAEFYMGGGTATINQIKMGGELTYAADHGADPGGQAVLTLSGTNNPSLSVSTLRLNERTNQFTSVVNLNAGRLTASSSVEDVTRTRATRNNCKSFLNFNGGSLTTPNAAHLGSGSSGMDRITVFGKGGSIEITTTGQADWRTPIVRPEGRGIKSITVPDEATTEGYAMPPVVYITGGGGEGATAHVRFDPRTGRIDREIEVTSPGWCFISAPTVTIKAPDMKTDVTCNVELTEGEQEDGGLTVKKGGSGSSAYLMVYAANTYTGDTVIAGGTFYVQNGSAVPPLSRIRLAGGHLATKDFNPSRARFGGYGSFASWNDYRLTITNELYYSAADLEQGRNIKCTGGHFYLGNNCVVSIDDFGSLTQDRYTLMQTSGTGIIHGTAKFANAVAAVNPCWRVSCDSSRILLRRLKGVVFSVR